MIVEDPLRKRILITSESMSPLEVQTFVEFLYGPPGSLFPVEAVTEQSTAAKCRQEEK